MANKFEKFQFVEVTRDTIHAADYNPRKISEKAFEKLKKKIKKDGLVQPIIVNKRTGNVVGGHQRLRALDELQKSTDYPLSVALIDVDEQKEIDLNLFLNNPSAMGDWDVDLLVNIKQEFPEIDFIGDAGFDKLDLDYIFSSANFEPEHIEGLFTESREQKAGAKKGPQGEAGSEKRGRVERVRRTR